MKAAVGEEAVHVKVAAVVVVAVEAEEVVPVEVVVVPLPEAACVVNMLIWAIIIIHGPIVFTIRTVPITEPIWLLVQEPKVAEPKEAVDFNQEGAAVQAEEIIPSSKCFNTS